MYIYLRAATHVPVAAVEKTRRLKPMTAVMKFFVALYFYVIISTRSRIVMFNDPHPSSSCRVTCEKPSVDGTSQENARIINATRARTNRGTQTLFWIRFLLRLKPNECSVFENNRKPRTELLQNYFIRRSQTTVYDVRLVGKDAPTLNKS